MGGAVPTSTGGGGGVSGTDELLDPFGGVGGFDVGRPEPELGNEYVGRDPLDEKEAGGLEFAGLPEEPVQLSGTNKSEEANIDAGKARSSKASRFNRTRFFLWGG